MRAGSKNKTTVTRRSKPPIGKIIQSTDSKLMHVQNGGDVRNAAALNIEFNNFLNQLSHEKVDVKCVKIKFLSDEQINIMTEKREIPYEVGAKDSSKLPKSDTGITNLNDPKCGYFGTDNECKTCGVDICTGHPARIVLPDGYEVIRPTTIENLINILQISCHVCGKFPLSEGEISKTKEGVDRIAAIRDKCKKRSKPCVHCHNNIKNEKYYSESLKLKKEIFTSPIHIDHALCLKYNHILFYKTKEILSDSGNVTIEKDKSRGVFYMSLERIKDILHQVEGVHLKNLNADYKIPCAISILGNKELPSKLLMKNVLVVSPVLRPQTNINGIMKNHSLTDSYMSILDACYTIKTSGNKGDIDYVLNHSKLNNSIVRLFMKNTQKIGTKIKVTIDQYISSGIEVKDASIDVDKSIAKTDNNFYAIYATKNGVLKTSILAHRKNRTLYTHLSTDDASLEFGYIGIPAASVYKLTVPLKITIDNIDAINSLRNYKSKFYPSGLLVRIRSESGKWIILGKNRELRIGDEVERALMDGDVVIFTRFPIIWKHSIVAAFAKIHDKTTLNLHPSMLEKHNADHDGDNGNVTVVRDPEAIRSAVSMAHLRNSTLTSSDTSSVIGLVMDQALSVLLMSYDYNVNKKLFRKVLLKIIDYLEFPGKTKDEQVENFIISLKDRVKNVSKYVGKKIRFYTGNILISACLPEELFYDKNGVKIVNGILIEGHPIKTHTGNSKGSITKIIIDRMGNEEACDYITKIAFLGLEYLEYFPLTLGINDLIIENYDLTKDEIKSKVDETIQSVIDKTYIFNTESDKEYNNEIKENFRAKMMEELNKLLMDISDIIKKKMNKNFKLMDDVYNRLMNGDDVNDDELEIVGYKHRCLYILYKIGMINPMIITQLIGMVGQQMYFDETISPQMSENSRVSIYDPIRSKTTPIPPTETGFVKSSYIDGLNMKESFFSYVSAVASTVNGHCRVPILGFLLNNLMAVLSDKHYVDGLIVSISGLINSFTYGDDGLNPEKLVSNKIKDEEAYVPFEINSIIDELNFKYS